MLDVTCNLYTYCMEVLAVFDDGVGVLCQDASFSAISCDLETRDWRVLTQLRHKSRLDRLVLLLVRVGRASSILV